MPSFRLPEADLSTHPAPSVTDTERQAASAALSLNEFPQRDIGPLRTADDGVGWSVVFVLSEHLFDISSAGLFPVFDLTGFQIDI